MLGQSYIWFDIGRNKLKKSIAGNLTRTVRGRLEQREHPDANWIVSKQETENQADSLRLARRPVRIGGH